MARSAKSKLCVAVPIALAMLGACSDDSSGSSAPPFPRERADVTATAFDIGWREESFSAAAGDVAIFVESEGSRHTLLVEDDGGDTVAGFELEVKRSGDVDAGIVTLEPGRYVIICDVPGHRSQGMEAPLTVTSS